jgi:hypothetical protein
LDSCWCGPFQPQTNIPFKCLWFLTEVKLPPKDKVVKLAWTVHLQAYINPTPNNTHHEDII